MQAASTPIPSCASFLGSSLMKKARRAVAVSLAILCMFSGWATRGLDAAEDNGVLPDLTLVPGDALGFVTLRVAEFWDADTVRRAQNQLIAKLPARADELVVAEKQLEQGLGIPWTHIERVTFFVRKIDAPLYIAVTTLEPFSPQEVQRAICPDGKEVKVAGKV